MPKDESPRITSIPPVTTECPRHAEPSDCVERETRKWVDEHFRNVQDESIEIIPDEIIIEVRRKNRKVEEYKIPSQDWLCVQDALDGFRLRFSDVITSEYSKLVPVAIKNIQQQIRFTCPQPEIVEVIKWRTIKVGVPSKRELEFEGLRDTVGLQRGKRSFRDMEQIASIRLNRWSPDAVKSIVREAREAVK